MFYTVGHPWQCKYRLLIQILILDALIQSLSSIKLTTKCDLAQRAGSGIRVNKGMCPLSTVHSRQESSTLSCLRSHRI